MENKDTNINVYEISYIGFSALPHLNCKTSNFLNILLKSELVAHSIWENRYSDTLQLF